MFIARADSHARRLLLCLLAPLPIRPPTCPSPQARALARQTKTCVDTGIHRHTPTKNALKPWRGRAGARTQIDYYMHAHTHTHTRAATHSLAQERTCTSRHGSTLAAHRSCKDHPLIIQCPSLLRSAQTCPFSSCLLSPSRSQLNLHSLGTSRALSTRVRITPTRPKRRTAHQSSCKILSAWNQPSCECLHGMSLLRPKRLAATWKWGPPTSR